VRVSGKNSTAESPRISERGLAERTNGHKMEVNTVEEGKINEVAGKKCNGRHGLRKAEEEV
jgi:hypothetical protein